MSSSIAISYPNISRGHITKTWYMTQNIKLQFVGKVIRENETLELLEEVPCGNNDRCRCDLAGVLYRNSEPIATIGIEIKNFQSDFNTGSGQNFEFDYNYIAVPSVLVGYAIRYLREKSMEWVGVLEIDEYGRLFFVVEAFQNKNPDYQSKTILGYNIKKLDMNDFIRSSKNS